MSKEKQKKSENVVWQQGKVSAEEREALEGHKGAVLWLTGLPASGKSTVAHELERRLTDKKIHAYILDGDNVRHGLNGDLGFTEEDRRENIRRIGEVAKLFMDAGTMIIVSFISPYKEDRDRVREIVTDGRFCEVFVDCPVDECANRDPKGLYKKAKAGEINNFTGISAPYEAPENPEVHLKTSENSLDECVDQIISFVDQNYLK